MKRNSISLILALLLSVSAFCSLQAQNWKVYLDFDKHTAEIAFDSSYLQMSGTLEIPGQFYYNNELYTVVGVGMGAFENCSRITSLVLPNSVTNINKDAFKNCTGLKTVRFGQSLKGIGWSAFKGCSGISSLTLPDSLRTVGWETFSGCSGLKELSIGSQLYGCGTYAFGGCHFDKVVYRGTVAQLCGVIFSTDEGSPLAHTKEFYIGDTLVQDLVIPNTVQSISR